MRGDDLEISVDTSFVAVGKELKRVLRGVDGFLLLLSFAVENAKGSQIVFDFLERGKGGLAVGGDGAVVVGESIFRSGMAAAAVEEFRLLADLWPRSGLAT